MDKIVTIPHLGRVEGHGGISVHISGREVVDVNMEIHEGSRYYEALLLGKHFLEVQGIITRVCAICSASHTVAALSALEHALGIDVSPRVLKLRGLLLLGGTIESHALHVFALALPDYLGFDSVLSMAQKYPAEVTFALKLKQLGNTIQALVGGRAVHPINTVVGGFGTIPSPADLESVRDKLIQVLGPLMGLVELASSIDIPSWANRPAVYLALRPYEPGYRFRGRSICTSLGNETPVERYRETIREYTVDHSTSKHTHLGSGGSYVVGAIARLRLWGSELRGLAMEAFERLFPAGVEDNILRNNWAQLVELVHCVERSIELCDELAAIPGSAERPSRYETRAGRGVSAIEVPRGTLIHEYVLDDTGHVVSADVVTPTTQNLNNTEVDLKHAVQQLLAGDKEVTDETIAFNLGMVARAYDPCISCSVHVIRDD